MSDTEEHPTVPRLALPFLKNDRNVLPALLRELYENLVTAFNANPELPPAGVMELVVQDYQANRLTDFLLLLERWGQNTYYPPLIWTESAEEPKVIFEEGVIVLIEQRTFRMKPFDQLPLNHDEFGGGDAFFDILEHKDAGISEEERFALMDLMDNRDIALGIRPPDEPTIEPVAGIQS